MAYIRYSADSKVYFYEHAEGGYECCACTLSTGPEGLFPRFYGAEAAAAHLYQHMRVEDLKPELVATVVDQLYGYVPKPLDLFLQDIISQARAGGGRVTSNDADVPAEIRVTMTELVAMLEAADSGDGDKVEIHIPEAVIQETPDHLREHM